MDPVVASSLISSAGVGTSNIANILLNSHNNKQNAKQWKEYANLQRELQSSQNAWNLAQWNRQNEYNSPANQMNLLRQAGLNPNLVYGNLSGASAGSLESAGADISSPTPNNAAQVSGFGDLGVQIGNQMMQKELNDANIEKINTEIESQRIDNAHKQFALNKQEETYKNQQDNIKSITDLNNSKSDEIQKNLGLIEANIRYMDAKEKSQTLENLFNEKTFEDRVKLVSSQLKLNQAQTRVLNKTIQKISQEMKTLKAQECLFWNQSLKASSENMNIVLQGQIMEFYKKFTQPEELYRLVSQNGNLSREQTLQVVQTILQGFQSLVVAGVSYGAGRKSGVNSVNKKNNNQGWNKYFDMEEMPITYW